MLFSRLLPLVLLVSILSWGCTESATDKAAPQGEISRIQGTVLAPLEGAQLYIYKKGMDLYGPAYVVSEATGPDGSYDVSLPAGEYIVVARKRQNGDPSGPVVAGDNKSEFVNLTVKGDVNDFTIRAPLKEGDIRRLTKEATATSTGFGGRITDSDGNPVEGARVHVYDHVQMSERPKFVSEKTGPDGAYQIYLPEGGTYYLAARNKFGGPPKLGDLYGRYDQGTIEPSAVVVREGEMLNDVDITVTKVW